MNPASFLPSFAPGLAQAADNFWDRGLIIPPQAVLVVLLVVVVTFGGLWLRQRYQRTRKDTSHLVLFHHLAAELGISLQDQWVLTRIARQQVLPTPLTLLLSGGTLRHHAELYAQTLLESKRPAMLERVASISRRMFGDGPETEKLSDPILTRQPSQSPVDQQAEG